MMPYTPSIKLHAHVMNVKGKQDAKKYNRKLKTSSLIQVLMSIMYSGDAIILCILRSSKLSWRIRNTVSNVLIRLAPFIFSTIIRTGLLFMSRNLMILSSGLHALILFTILSNRRQPTLPYLFL